MEASRRPFKRRPTHDGGRPDAKLPKVGDGSSTATTEPAELSISKKVKRIEDTYAKFQNFAQQEFIEWIKMWDKGSYIDSC
jgi:hypothetical protein